ncbi:glycine oxidase ThiO [Bacillus lacus]|uniref:glycine oxidase n=1 Tax=Metabacillus lacus TaxID=1983721 RepID=A0A7X2J1N1_9BACI|nr:glycine oxidase ThiO [Metabacillus lacus]MRX73710.1 glycine oxidase ThiO [Metabacillus lacus]
MNNNHTFEVCIIGGGVIGLSIAYYLAREGVKAAVFEKDVTASKASSAAAGMLGAHSELSGSPQYREFALSSQAEYTSLAEELYELTGIDIELVNKGMLKLAASEKELHDLKRQVLLHNSLSLLSAQETSEMEPYLSKETLGGLYIPGDGHVEPQKLAAAFKRAAVSMGTEIFEHTSVLSIDEQKNRLVTDRGSFSFRKLVIAGGVWSGLFTQKLGISETFYPVKGECFSVMPPAKVLTKTIFYDECYLVPKRDGRIVVGATMVPNDWNTDVSAGGISFLAEKLKAVFPELAACPIRTFWAGLRPQNTRKMPLITEHPENRNLLIAAGHYRNGILLAPGTGQYIRDLILEVPGRKHAEDFCLKKNVGVQA